MKSYNKLSALKKFIVVGTASVLCSTMLALPSVSATPGSDFTTAYSATTGTLLTESLWMGIVNNVASLMDSVAAVTTATSGTIKALVSTETCDGALNGAIRSTGSTVEFCDGSNWSAMGAGAVADEAPTAFSFADQTMVTQNTTITSNAVIVSGFDGPLTAYCSTNCTAVKRNDGSWDTSASGFMPGDTITIQLTSNATPSGTKIASVNLGDTTSASWTVTSDQFVCGTDTATGRSPDVITYPTVVGEDGRCWLAKNLGATNVATSASDTTARGWFYQLGRTNDGGQILPATILEAGPSTTLSPGNKFITGSYSADWTSLDSDGAIRSGYWTNNTANNPCPSGFRVPTGSEWTALDTAVGGFSSYAKNFGSNLKLATQSMGIGEPSNGTISFFTDTYFATTTHRSMFKFGNGATIGLADGYFYAPNIRCIRN